MITNLFDAISEQADEEIFETLVQSDSVHIERIVSTGQSSPADFWYDQPTAEWVVVLKGSAQLQFKDDNEPLVMSEGDFVNIPAHKKHRVASTSREVPTVWLAVHYE